MYPPPSGGGADQSADDAAAFSLSPPVPQSVWILPDNWPVVRAFTACITQWCYGPSGPPDRVGLCRLSRRSNRPGAYLAQGVRGLAGDGGGGDARD